MAIPMKTKLTGVICSLLLSTAHGAAHISLTMEDTIGIIDTICTGEKNKERFHNDMKVCSEIEYQHIQGVVFARFYTLQGVFFAFSEPRLFDSENGIEDMEKNLSEQTRKHFVHGLYAVGRFILKQPVKLIYYPYEVPPPARVIAYYHLATIYENIVARCKEIFRKPGQRRFIPQPDPDPCLDTPRSR